MVSQDAQILVAAIRERADVDPYPYVANMLLFLEEAEADGERPADEFKLYTDLLDELIEKLIDRLPGDRGVLKDGILGFMNGKLVMAYGDVFGDNQMHAVDLSNGEEMVIPAPIEG